MFLKAVKGRRLNLRTPNTSTELSINLVDSCSLNFLDCRAEMCTKNFKTVKMCQKILILSSSIHAFRIEN